MGLTVDSDRARQLEGIAGRFNLDLVLLFGSHVTGRTHPRSDIDLAVRFLGEMPDLEVQAALQGELSSLFAEDVDLAVINQADPLFLRQITKACRLLYGEARDLAELKLAAFRRYQDFKPYLELEARYVRRFVEGHRP